MSFDIWLGCFKNGKYDYFPREIVEEAFGRFAERRAATYYTWFAPKPENSVAMPSLDCHTRNIILFQKIERMNH